MTAPMQPGQVQVVGYSSVSDLRDAMAPQDFLALFDDANAGEVPDVSTAVQSCLRRARAEVRSNLATICPTMPVEQPGPVSDLLQLAETAYAKFFAYERRPALAVKISPTYLKDLWSAAEKRMDRIKDAIQTFAPNDNPPPTPSNIGGIVTDNGPRVSIDNADGTSNLGDF